MQILGNNEDERTFWCSAGVAARYEDGRPKMVVEFLQDISERKQTHREIETLKQQLEFILGVTKTGIDIIDSDYNIQYIDPEWQKAYGDPAGKKCYEYFMGESEPCSDCGIVNAMETKAPVVTEEILAKEGDRPIQVTTIPFQNEKGDWLFAEVNVDISETKKAEEQLKGAYDQAIIYAEQLREEIEERKRAVQALQESEEKYRTLFEDSRDAIYMTTRDGWFMDVNQAALDLFGYTREEMLGLDLREIYVDLEDRPRFQKEIEGKGSVRDYGMRFQKKDGTEMDCLVTATLRRADDGSILGYQGIIRDTTEQKRLENQLQQAQKMEAVGNLAGGISHDFNNILQAISGYIQLLLMKKEVYDTDRHYLKQIEKAAERAGELTKQLLVFSRKVKSKLRPIDLNHEIFQIHGLLQRTIPKMIDIELHLTDDLKLINADPIQLEQIIMNLVLNAKDAMPDGGKLIFETNNVILNEQFCQIHIGAVPGEYALLSISDTGQGMDKKIVEHIFEPFYTTKETGKGTGLGLAMVYGIVKSHGGYITCYSEPDHGTVFKIYFPFLEVESLEREVEREHADALRRGHETILLVDDEEMLREQGREILYRYGYKTLTAENAETAIEIYKKEKDRIDLVTLDIGMPGMGGYKCLQELLKIDPDVKVIIASGYTSSANVKEALESGASGFIGKPYDLKDMLKTVRALLDQSENCSK
jgi:two-component system, cell cycle sensor histidine kinase and response regulator CckA